MPDGTIVDTAGNPLLDTAGRPIRLSPTDTPRSRSPRDGTLSSENGQIAQVGVVRPQDPMRLTAEGGTLLAADAPTRPMPSPGIVQGAVEDRNVQPIAGAHPA